jgi:glycosyltransferase involved in cell wall biosynthesis
VGGSETLVRGLLGQFADGTGPEHVTALANRHVMSAYGQYARGPVRLEHVRTYRPGASNATRFAAMHAGRVFPRLGGRDFDLVHYPVTVPVPRVSAPRRVVTLLDIQHHALPEMFSAAERRFRRWAYDGAARGADLVLTISEHARGGIIERLGIAPEKVEAIPLGVDHSRFRPDGSKLQGLPDRYVVYPANMWPHKNHARLLEAFAQVDDPDLTLVLTGQTYGRDTLLAGRERVLHLGHVPFADLPALYRGALALVFPSLFEGFGIPPLEAMACGTPVAASGEGALREVVAEAGVAFEPRDTGAIAEALARVTTDDELRSRLREAGLRRAASFTWQATAERHVAAYSRVLDR